jgi:hypothetical protein
MTDAPERIWHTSRIMGVHSSTEYTRTDTSQARIAQLEAELKGWQDQFKAQFPDAIAALKAKP